VKWDFTKQSAFSGDGVAGGVSGVLWSHATEVRRVEVGSPFTYTFPRHEAMDAFSSGDARYRYRIVPARLYPKPEPFGLLCPECSGGALDLLGWYVNPALAVSELGPVHVMEHATGLGEGMTEYVEDMMTDQYTHVGPTEPMFGTGFPMLRLEHISGVLLDAESGKPVRRMRRRAVASAASGETLEGVATPSGQDWTGIAAMSSEAGKLYELVDGGEDLGVLSYDLETKDHEVVPLEDGSVEGEVLAMASRPRDLIVAVAAAEAVRIERWHRYPGKPYTRALVATFPDLGPVDEAHIRSVNRDSVLVSLVHESETVLFRMAIHGRCARSVK